MRIRLTTSLMAILLSCIAMVGQSGLRPRGDVNCDWEVSMADVNSLIDSVLNGAKYHGLYSYATDVNSDKEITIADLNMLISSLLGDELPPMPSFSGTLPVLYINTEGHHNIDGKDKESYLHADWWLNDMGIEGYESIGSAQEPLGMVIKGRGNYTWNNFDKKSFRIKLDTKHKLMGMKSNRHFCLLAHADDHLAKLKNTIGFEMSRRIGLAYTPAQEPVEVVLNGQYIGLYFLTEKVRAGNNRVNIEEQNDLETNPSLITGGWLLELNDFDGEVFYVQEHYMNGYDWDDMLVFLSLSPEVLSPAQRNYMRNFLTNANIAIQTDDLDSTEWEKYIDLDSLVRFYIVGEIMDDIEHFAGSCYMHKHRGDSTKLIFGPVWDFGNAFTREAHYGPDSVGHFIYEQPSFIHSHWIEEMAKFPRFQRAVRQCWNEFCNSGFNGLELDRFIDDFVDRITPAYTADLVRWPGHGIENQKKEFKRYIHAKIDWLNSQWSDPDPGTSE